MGTYAVVKPTRRRLMWTARVAVLLGLVAQALSAITVAPGVLADGGAPNLAYIVEAGPASGVAIMDIAQRRLVGHVAINGDPRSVILGADSRFVYVSEAANDRIAVVDANTRRVVAAIPAGRGPGPLAYSAVTGNLLVADTTGDTVTIINVVERRVIATVPVGNHPSGIGVAEPGSGITATVGDEAYVANMGDNTVSVINVAKRKVVAVVSAPGGPLAITVPANGGVGYVATRAGTVLAIGLADHRLLGILLRTTSGKLGIMDYDAVTGAVYVPDAGANVVYELRPATAAGAGTSVALPAEPVRALPFSGGPVAVAITFEGAYGFVAEGDSARVQMFDPAAREVIATLNVGGAPRAIVTAPYPAAPVPTTRASAGPPTWLWIALAVVVLALLAAGGYVIRGRLAGVGAVLTGGRGSQDESDIGGAPATGSARAGPGPVTKIRVGQATRRPRARTSKSRSRRRGARR